jgi:flagellar biosynthesis protein FlhB
VSEDAGEKRFDATPSQRDRATRAGNAAQSHEIASIAAFGSALAGLAATLPLLAAAMAAALRTRDPRAALTLVAIALVPALCAATGGTCATLAQTGGLRLRALALDVKKLAPLPGLKRLFGSEAAIGGTRALLAFAVVSAVVAPLGLRAVATASNAATPGAAAAIVRDAMLQACCSALAAGGLFAFADYALVRMRWLRSLKMTFEAFKRDAREQDGDPQTKSRRKHAHRSLVRGAIARTREASFVVVNPTHVAIAIRYAPPAVAVPEILVRAADARALDVRAIAERARIPIVEEPALARLLWRIGTAGRAIPTETFVAVATVIAALVRAGVISP